MTRYLDGASPCAALTNVARDFHQRGWMAGTAGNLSARDCHDIHTFWITASGLPKGQLDERDFLRLAISNGAVVECGRTDAKPSAEASIHQAIYQLFPQVRACLHVHSVEACLVTIGITPDTHVLSLPPLEMLKGLGIWDEHPQATLPLFPNLANVTAIAELISRRFAAQAPSVPALLIQEHGITVWGESVQEAYNRVEITEFLMRYLIHARSMTIPPS